MPMNALTMNLDQLGYPTDLHACNARVRDRDIFGWVNRKGIDQALHTLVYITSYMLLAHSPFGTGRYQVKFDMYTCVNSGLGGRMAEIQFAFPSFKTIFSDELNFEYASNQGFFLTLLTHSSLGLGLISQFNSIYRKDYYHYYSYYYPSHLFEKQQNTPNSLTISFEGERPLKGHCIIKLTYYYYFLNFFLNSPW
jgi:hypothetical protein